MKVLVNATLHQLSAEQKADLDRRGIDYSHTDPAGVVFPIEPGENDYKFSYRNKGLRETWAEYLSITLRKMSKDANVFVLLGGDTYAAISAYSMIRKKAPFVHILFSVTKNRDGGFRHIGFMESGGLPIPPTGGEGTYDSRAKQESNTA